MTHDTRDSPTLPALQRGLANLVPHHDAARWMQLLVADGLDVLPPPGCGQTLHRWQSLAAVAAHDLSLAKLYEGHTDALGILNELSHPLPPAPQSVWGVWAAEAPAARVVIQPDTAAGAGTVHLTGLKGWCSGASAGRGTSWRSGRREIGTALTGWPAR